MSLLNTLSYDIERLEKTIVGLQDDIHYMRLRIAAIERGETKYQGRLCSTLSHSGVRYTSTNICCDCVARVGKPYHKKSRHPPGTTEWAKP